MLKPKIWLLLFLGRTLMVLSMLNTWAGSAIPGVTVARREVPQQVVLYTVHRGSYDKVGETIGKLFGLAAQKGFKPSGPVTFVYLNNPTYLKSQHWLTEVQLPVSKEALALAGTLGQMTDVKTLSARTVAVAEKPEGQADPGPIYEKLYSWIQEGGYVAIDGPFERFLTNAETGNYAKMKSEIMFPIERLTSDKAN